MEQIVESLWYKIVEYNKGEYKTLFHGVDGSRVLPLNQWIEADIKEVKDGTSKTSYMSGWHIASLETIKDYLKAFKKPRDLRVVACEAKEIWSKAHSRHDIFLSQYIRILGEVNYENISTH